MPLLGAVDVLPLLGAIAGAIAGCHCSVLWLGGGIFLYIDNTKIGFGYLGSMLVLFDVKME